MTGEDIEKVPLRQCAQSDLAKILMLQSCRYTPFNDRLYLYYIPTVNKPHKMRSWSTQISESGKSRRFSTVLSLISTSFTWLDNAPHSARLTFACLNLLTCFFWICPAARFARYCLTGSEWLGWSHLFASDNTMDRWQNSDEADPCLMPTKSNRNRERLRPVGISPHGSLAHKSEMRQMMCVAAPFSPNNRRAIHIYS
jgi:hypothetical protein